LCPRGAGVTFAGVQTTHKIAGNSAVGYAAYLTSSSDRGDYYLTSAGASGGDGADDGGGVQSRWHGSPELLDSLGLSPDGPVGRDELLDLMNGVSPAGGEQLRRAGANGSRVAGIDLTFSAPKSVSALWAVSGPGERGVIERAHREAVASTIARIEREVALVRERVNGQVRHERARSVLAAEFVHTSSRLTRNQEQQGVPDPQLHSHVVVLGAQRMDGRFAAVDSRPLFLAARENGGWYRAELARGLERRGLAVQGQTGRDGRYFEVAGVPKDLSERWSARSVDIERAAARFRERYGRDPRAGELGTLTTGTRGTKGTAGHVDVNEAWRAVGAEHSLTREQARDLFTGIDQGLDRSVRGERSRDLARELSEALVRERATVSEREVRARAYELAVGWGSPEQADRVVEGLVREGELIGLADGRWTTRELREREQQMLTVAGARASERVAPVSEQALKEARVQAGREIGGSLSVEQREALQLITGTGGVSVLVGQAGTGKGVVIATAAGAWRSEGYEVIGTAVAGATAERLGQDAKLERSLTTDSLLAKVHSGQLALNEKTVVVMDEAGMADTQRLSSLIEETDRSQSKLVLVGDQAQLSAIGAGGMFGAIQANVPTAQLREVHRAEQAWERDAWRQIREGASEQALAQYVAHGQLHLSDTREQAAERMVQAWAKDRAQSPEKRTVMLTDASNRELDRINQKAQELRDQNNELGADRVQIPDLPYSIAGGDEVVFTKSMFVPGGEGRVENGTRATVLQANSKDNQLLVQTEGATPREVSVNTEEHKELRLGYAQHVYKAQGLTVDRAHTMLGGWQSDRERAYVAVSRSREQTDIYAAREDLGEQGMDAGAIERLGETIAESHAQQPSIATPTATLTASELAREHQPAEHPEQTPTAQLAADAATTTTGQPTYERESEAATIMYESHNPDNHHDLDHGHDLGYEI
jgi:conjugative relaxase-like TrwC/TraI family protein